MEGEKMKKSMVLTAFLLSVCFAADTGCLAAQQADIQAKVDEYMQRQIEVYAFSGSILIARGGQVLVSEGYGMADLEHEAPNTPQTKYRLGSVTKQFTAMLVMQLQEKGMLSVDDPLTKYIPDYPNGEKITIHHLLTHTSGIPNFTSFPDYQETMTLPSPPEKSIERFKDKPLDFEPGEKFSYSNSGYILLGYIIEKATGRSYEDLLRERILQPLGMDDTGYDHTETVLKNRASGYAIGADELINCSYLDMTIPHAAGALYSTVEDLYKWDRALYADKLVGKASLEMMFTPFKGNYAYGWGVREESGRKIIAHAGGINGFVTMISRYVNDDAVVIVLSNLETVSTGKISHDLAAILFGEIYELPELRVAVELDESLLKPLAGEYELRPGLILTVSLKDGRLFSQVGDEPRQQLYPESETKFFYKLEDVQVTFVKDESGAVVSMTFNAGGRVIPAKKIK
jgi:CubicO group peptidase (beta-lactamase class C family)